MMSIVEENYFSKENEWKYTGSSQIKALLNCPAREMAILNGEWIEEKTTSQMVGSYVDASMSGTLDIFKAQNPELFKKDGTLKAEFLQAQRIYERIEKDPMFKKYISGDHQTIMTFMFDVLNRKWLKYNDENKVPENCIPIKIKIDSYFPGKAIVDLKVVKDFEPMWNPKTQSKENFIDYWNYALQAALYQKGVEINTNKQLPFFIAAVTKEKEPDIALLNIPQEVLDEKLVMIEEALPIVYAIKNKQIIATRCEHCDYCKATKVLTSIIDYRDL